MTPSELDLPAIGGGLSILGAMVLVIRMAFKRLDAQDTGWQDLLAAAERRAEAAEITLSEVRKHIREERETWESARQQHFEAMQALRDELSEAKMQIRELQHWETP